MRYRHLRRTVIAVLAAVAFLLLVGAVAVRLLDSERARSWAARWIEGQARAVGVELEIGALHWGSVPPRLLLDDLVLSTAGVHAEVQRLSADLAGVRLAERTLILDTMAAHGVRVRLSGLPSLPARGGSWLRLRVKRLDLDQLEVDGRQLPGSLAVHLAGLSGAWAGDGATARGFVRCQRIALEVPGMEPLAAGLLARFTLGDGISVPSWRVVARGAELRGRASLSSAGTLRAEAEGPLDLGELDRLVRAGGVLDGECWIVASLASDREPLLDVHVRSPEIVAAGFPVYEPEAHIELGPGGLIGTLDGGRLHGGELRGTYTLGRFGPSPPHRVEARGSGVELAGFLTSLGVPAGGLAAAADLEAELEWSGGQIARGHGRGQASLRRRAGVLPVEGRLKVELAPEGLLLFEARQLQVGGSVVSWQGPLTLGTWQPAWTVEAAPAVFAELGPMVNVWAGAEVVPAEIAGQGSLQVDLAGPFDQLRVGVRVEAEPLLYPPMQLDRVVAELVVTSSEVEVMEALYRLGDGDGAVSGTIVLAPEAGDAVLDLDIRGQRIPLQSVAAWLGVEELAAGTASFTGGLRGPLRSPRGSWALGLVGVSAMGRELGDGSATVDLDEGAFTARNLSFSGGLGGELRWAVGAGEVAGELSWPGMPVALLGKAAAELLGSSCDVRTDFLWSLDRPLVGKLRAVNEGFELEVVADQTGVGANARLGDAAVASVALARDPEGRLKGPGRLRLDAVEDVVERLLPLASVPARGSAEVAFEVDWPPGDWPQLAGTLEALDLELEERPARLLEPAAFSLSAQGVEIEGLRLSLLGDEVFLRLGIGADGGLRGNVAGTLDALLLRFLIPEWEPAGRATGVVELLGSLDEPRLEGVAHASQASFRVPASRLVVSGIDGTLLLSSDEMILEGMQFRVMHGAATCAGRLGRREGQVRLDLDGAVSNLELPLFPGLVPRLRGSWSLDGSPGDLLLSGELEIERAALHRQDDLAAILMDWLAAPPGAEGGGLQLDLHVEADRTIEARSPFIRVVGSASLDVTGSAEQPGLVGQIELMEGGDFSFQGVRYELDRCTLSFSDPLRMDPFLDLQARAWVQTYQITVRLTGTFDRLVPVLTSDPPLPEAEIFSLLALGFRNDAVGGGAVGVGLASTLLTREINAELERRARTLLPVDQVRIDPFAEASTGNPTARITVVKQLSPTWTVILQSNLTSNREEVVVSRWFLGPGLYLEATRDVDGTYSADLKMRRRY